MRDMRKGIYIEVLFALLHLSAWAQAGMEEVLRSVEENNKSLQAGRQLIESRKLDARTGNYLPNPTIEWNQLWADKSVGGNANELAVVQSFDFPSVYINKNRLARVKEDAAEWEYAVLRQQVLLKAQQVCLEIIYLRQQKALLTHRLENASCVERLYRQRLASGDANQLEYNKIQLEKINAGHASRRNEAALQVQLEQLKALNGGMEVAFAESDFPKLPVLPSFEELEKEYLGADPNLRNLSREAESAQYEIKVNRGMSLPKFDIGYRRTGGSSETMNGFRVGMSIPLWENRNTVRRAKAQAEYTVMVLEDNTQVLRASLRELYLQAESLRASRDEYEQIFARQRNEELLQKALEAGQISMLEYFVEITLLYDSMQNYLDVEREYRNVMGQLLQYTL